MYQSVETIAKHQVHVAEATRKLQLSITKLLPMSLLTEFQEETLMERWLEDNYNQLHTWYQEECTYQSTRSFMYKELKPISASLKIQRYDSNAPYNPDRIAIFLVVQFNSLQAWRFMRSYYYTEMPWPVYIYFIHSAYQVPFTAHASYYGDDNIFGFSPKFDCETMEELDEEDQANEDIPKRHRSFNHPYSTQ